MAWFVAIHLAHFLLQKHLSPLYLAQCQGISSDEMEVLLFVQMQ